MKTATEFWCDRLGHLWLITGRCNRCGKKGD